MSTVSLFEAVDAKNMLVLLCLIFCTFSADVSAAETKEDPILLFKRVSQHLERLDSKSCDKLLRSGTAQAFAKSLFDQCRLHQQSLEASVADAAKSKNCRILHISELCRAFALILSCSDSDIKSASYSTMKEHVVASIPYVVQMMMTLEGFDSLQLSTVNNAVRIMHSITPLLDRLPEEFITSAAPLLDERMPTDVRIEAALSVACFLTHKSSTTFELDAEICHRLVSILSVSASTSIESNADRAMKALAMLMTFSAHFARTGRRKCCILAAKQNLLHERKAIRRWAFEILDAVVKSHERDNGPAGILASSMECVVQALVEGATAESDTFLLQNILDLLVRIVTSDSLPIGSSNRADILKVLAKIASSSNDGLHSTEHAAVCYLKAATKCLQDAHVVGRVVDFMASPYAPVRSQAFAMVQDLVFWRPSMAEVLLRQTRFMEKISSVLRNGRAQERAAVIQTCKSLVSETQNHSHFLQYDDFVNALADFITSNETKDLCTVVAALNILLDFMLTTENGMESFLKKLDLLPWMVSLANRTSCSKVKVRLIAAIQRMTLRLLSESD